MLRADGVIFSFLRGQNQQPSSKGDVSTEWPVDLYGLHNSECTLGGREVSIMEGAQPFL